MFQDGFKSSYTTIPFAFYLQPEENLELHLPTHHHKEVELIAMISGEVDFYIENVGHRLRAGDVLVIPPYCMHRADLVPNTSYDCVCFDLSLLWDKELRRELESGKLTVAGPLSSAQEYTPLMNRCVRDSIAARQQHKPGWEMDVIGNLSLMFGRLKEDSFFVKSEEEAVMHQFLRNVFEYVLDHFHEPITSRDAARALHINHSYFCRLFRKSFGCCFTEYLINFRLEKAKLLLKNSTLPISDIALKTGFCSFSYFSKMFKATLGVTPSQYRRSL